VAQQPGVDDGQHGTSVGLPLGEGAGRLQVAMDCGRPSGPCCRPRHSAMAAEPASMTRLPGRLRLPASQWGCPGGCCRSASWVAAAGHLLAVVAQLAARRGGGGSCTTCCSTSSAPGPARLVPRQPGQRERARPAGGCPTGPSPTDRGKPGSTYHLLVDRRGIPLAACLSAANTHDSLLLSRSWMRCRRSRAGAVGRLPSSTA
jgi:hypothetical protein